jgi:hypothetical protein
MSSLKIVSFISVWSMLSTMTFILVALLNRQLMKTGSQYEAHISFKCVDFTWKCFLLRCNFDDVQSRNSECSMLN